MNNRKLYSLVPLFEAVEGNPAAIGAFNVNFYAQAEGILEGLGRAEAPGIIQASKGANKFQGGAGNIRQMVLAAIENLQAKVPVCLHLDHGDYEGAVECMSGGFSSVMVDYSTTKDKKKRGVKDNANLTRPIVLAAKERGISVEGEMGVLAGQEEDVSSEISVYPTPQEVVEYSRLSGVDAIAVACGTVHGAVKRFKTLEFELLENSYKGLRNDGFQTGIVLHGSSTVPPELIAEVNNYGGALAGASGVPMNAIKKALPWISKINIDTDLRLGITAVFRRYLHEHPEAARESEALGLVNSVFNGKIIAKEKDGSIVDPAKMIDPRSYLQPIVDKMPRFLREDYRNLGDEHFANAMNLVRQRVADHVEYLVHEFGSVGLAGKIQAD